MANPRISYVDPATIKDAAMLAEIDRCRARGHAAPGEPGGPRARAGGVLVLRQQAGAICSRTAWRIMPSRSCAGSMSRARCMCECLRQPALDQGSKAGRGRGGLPRPPSISRSSTRYDERQKAALSYAEAITWDLPVDDAFWARLHKHFSEPELVEIGYFIALTMGQQRWLRLLDIEHHQVLSGTAASMAPGFENEEALKRSKQTADYWGKAPHQITDRSGRIGGITRTKGDGRSLPGGKSRRGAGRLRVPRPRRLDGEGVCADPGSRSQRRAGNRISGRLHPAHPVWYHHHSATGALSNRLAVELFKNAVEIPGPQTEELARAARDANAYVVIGRLREDAQHPGHHVQHAGLSRSRRHADRQAPEDHADRRRAARAYGRIRRHVRCVPDRVRADQRIDLRRELQSPCRLRLDRGGHPHPRHELAQSFPDERRSDAQPGELDPKPLPR